MIIGVFFFLVMIINVNSQKVPNGCVLGSRMKPENSCTGDKLYVAMKDRSPTLCCSSCDIVKDYKCRLYNVAIYQDTMKENLRKSKCDTTKYNPSGVNNCNKNFKFFVWGVQEQKSVCCQNCPNSFRGETCIKNN